MKTKIINRILAVILIAVVSTSFFVLPTFGKCIWTAHKLFGITQEIMYLNEAASKAKPGYGWSTERSESYYALDAERQAIYNSDDAIVATFATASNFAQLGILTGLFLAFLLEIASLLILFLRWSRKIARYKKRKNVKV